MDFEDRPSPRYFPPKMVNVTVSTDQGQKAERKYWDRIKPQFSPNFIPLHGTHLV